MRLYCHSRETGKNLRIVSVQINWKRVTWKLAAVKLRQKFAFQYENKGNIRECFPHICTEEGYKKEVLSILIPVCGMKLYNTVTVDPFLDRLFCCCSCPSAESIHLGSVKYSFQKHSHIPWELPSYHGLCFLQHRHPTEHLYKYISVRNYSDFRNCHQQQSLCGFPCVFSTSFSFINRVQVLSIP